MTSIIEKISNATILKGFMISRDANQNHVEITIIIMPKLWKKVFELPFWSN